MKAATSQILRFAEIEINPCNSTLNTGTKKSEWRVTIRHQDKKMVDELCLIPERDTQYFPVAFEKRCSFVFWPDDPGV